MIYEYGIGAGPFIKGISEGHIGAKRAWNNKNMYISCQLGNAGNVQVIIMFINYTRTYVHSTISGKEVIVQRILFGIK